MVSLSMALAHQDAATSRALLLWEVPGHVKNLCEIHYVLGAGILSGIRAR